MRNLHTVCITFHLIRVLKFLCVAMAVRKMHKINRKSPGYGSLIEISVEKISMAAGQTHTHTLCPLLGMNCSLVRN